MRIFNFKPLGLGNAFENRKMYIEDPCYGFQPSYTDDHLSSTNDVFPPNYDESCGPMEVPSRPGVAFCENTGNVYYFPTSQQPIEIQDPIIIEGPIAW